MTGSRDRNCPADTWILSAQPGQRIELIVRDYTSRGVATSPGDNHVAAAADTADDDEPRDGEDVDDTVENERKSRSEICTNLIIVLTIHYSAWRNADLILMRL